MPRDIEPERALGAPRPLDGAAADDPAGRSNPADPAHPGDGDPGDGDPADPGEGDPAGPGDHRDPDEVGATEDGTSEGDPADGSAPRRRRRGLRAILPKPIWQLGRLLILALVVEYLVVPQLAGPRKVAHLITEVNPLLLVAGVALEAGALVCYAQLTRTVLPRERKLSLSVLLRIQLTTLSVSHCAPGGSATGAALGYRLMTNLGVAPSDVGFALGMQGIGSAIVLNILLWVALIVSIPVWGFSAVYLLAAGVGALLLIAALLLLLSFTRGEARVGAALERFGNRVPFIDGAALRRSFVQVAKRLTELNQRRSVLIWAGVWAAANWLLDAASLAVFVGAFGHWVNPDGLLVAYGLAYVLAAIPITPGGLGVVEATLTSLLVGFGTPRGVATLGVVAYRLVNFWLPIPLGGFTYLSLQGSPFTRGTRRVSQWASRGRHRGMGHAVRPEKPSGS